MRVGCPVERPDYPRSYERFQPLSGEGQMVGLEKVQILRSSVYVSMSVVDQTSVTARRRHEVTNRAGRDLTLTLIVTGIGLI